MTIIFCRNCGSKNKKKAKFCSGCGSPIAVIEHDNSHTSNRFSTSNIDVRFLGALGALSIILLASVVAWSLGWIGADVPHADIATTAVPSEDDKYGAGGSVDWGTKYTDKFLSTEESFYVTGIARARSLPTSEGSDVIRTYNRGNQLRGRWVEGKDPTTKWLRTENGDYVWEGNIGGPDTIHPSGMDGLFVGNSFQAMQGRLSSTGRYGSQMSNWDSSCEIYSSKDGKFDVMFENGTATSFATSDRYFVTQKGIKVGMSKAELYRAYEDKLTRETNPYAGEDIFFWLRKGEGINFHIDDSGLIDSIKSGTSSIEYVEGCL